MKKRMVKIIAAAMSAALLTGASAALSACDGYCQHNLETHFRTESTCVLQGEVMHYECTKCHKLFRWNSEEGLYEIHEAPVLPFADHDFGAEVSTRLKPGITDTTKLNDYEYYRACKNCGEEFVVTTPNFAPMATVTSSSIMLGGWEADKLVDGVIMNEERLLGWASLGHNTPDEEEWVLFDFGMNVTFNEVDLYPRGCGDYFPVDYVLETSHDGKTFTPVRIVTGDPDSIAFRAVVRAIRLEEAATARYFRVRATKLSTNQSGTERFYFEMSEVEIYYLEEGVN